MVSHGKLACGVTVELLYSDRPSELLRSGVFDFLNPDSKANVVFCDGHVELHDPWWNFITRAMA